MNKQALAAHILHALAQAQIEGRTMNLDLLARELHVRRGDVRRMVSTLDRQGFLDALYMRLTLIGFAVGRSFRTHGLPELRPSPRSTRPASRPASRPVAVAA